MKNYCFGDSFIGIFKLVDSCRVFKFKGATAKGLTKPNSENREKIINVIEGLDQRTRDNSCFLFQFGSVDVHHSYFYRLFTDSSFDPNDIEGFVFPIVEGYVKVINSLPCRRKVILAPHYSPIEDENVYPSLLRYEVVKEEESRDLEEFLPYLTREWRNRIVDAFCLKLEAETGLNNIHLLDLRGIVSENGRLLPQFIDQSKYNIHLIWETLILEYVKYLGGCGITRSNVDLSQYAAYVEEKAERMRTGKYPDRKK